MPPILLLIFNRPGPTQQVFETVRAARPARLYVAADGPRVSRAGEGFLCEEARRVATAVDWPCEVRTLFRASNLGCGRAVSEALNWFFAQEPEGIVLEDDCVPDPTFFRFAGELLERYRDDSRVMSIGAQHHPGPDHRPAASYYFSRYQHCWGWASWRRAWALYDRELGRWPALRHTPWLRQQGGHIFARYWRTWFDAVRSGEIDTWDYQWTFSHFLHSGLAAMPDRTLVTNIGFGDDATHTIGAGRAETLAAMDFPLTHPVEVQRDPRADALTQARHYPARPANLFPAYRRLKQRLMKLVSAARGSNDS